MNIFAKLTVQTMKTYKVRTIVTIIGVLLSTAMITAVTTFASSFTGFLVTESEKIDGRWHFAAKELTRKEAEQIAALPEIRFSGTLTDLGFALYESVAQNSPRVPYVRVWTPSKEMEEIMGFILKSGRLPENEEEILIPYYMTANENEGEATCLGDQITLSLGRRMYQEKVLELNAEYANGEENGKETLDIQETRTYKVVGFYEYYPVSRSFAAYDCYTGPSSDWGKEHVTLYGELKNPKQVYQFVREHLDEDQTEYNGSLLRWLGAFDNEHLQPILSWLYGILIVVIMVGAVSLIYNAFSISLRERTAQFGILSSVGATRKQLRKTFFYEASVISVLGIPLGILSGIFGIGIALHFAGPGIAQFIHGIEAEIPLRVSAPAIFWAAAIAFLTVMISAWIPSFRIRKLTPLEAIRSSTDRKLTAREVKVHSITYRLFGLEGILAKKNYKRDKRKYRTTIFSLTISIVLFVTASLYTDYLINTGRLVLQAPEIELLYTYYGEDAPADKISKVIAENEETRELLSFYQSFTELRMSGEENIYQVCQVLVLPEDDFQKVTGSTSEEYVKRAEGTGSVPVAYLDEISSFNGKTKRYERKKVFETLQKDQPVVGGIWSYQSNEKDYRENAKWLLVEEADPKALPEGFADVLDDSTPYLLTSEEIYEQYMENWIDKGLYTTLIKCPDHNVGYPALESAMREKNLLETEGSLNNLAEVYERDRGILLAIRVMTYGFIVLISLIAVANIFHTISTNLFLRRKEFAMLRSMGLSRRGFQKMMSYECLIYGCRSIIYGVLFSILISRLLYDVLNIGADTAFLMPWPYLFFAAAGVFLVVAVTMAYTMKKISEANIVDELKMN